MLLRVLGEKRFARPATGRVPEGMREDFRDIASRAGYGACEIDDFIEGRTLTDDDAPANGDGEPSAWISLEATRVDCVTYLEARQALADVHEGRV